jgi:hypothetical protein
MSRTGNDQPASGKVVDIVITMPRFFAHLRQAHIRRSCQADHRQRTGSWFRMAMLLVAVLLLLSLLLGVVVAMWW